MVPVSELGAEVAVELQGGAEQWSHGGGAVEPWGRGRGRGTMGAGRGSGAIQYRVS